MLKRLIDFGDSRSPTVFLRDFSETPSAQIGKYTCLSHRWDSTSSGCIITVEHFNARKDNIELSSLPPTLQDAIGLTRALRLQYILVDTLCTLQGSETDWAEESAKMGSCYSFNWVTIGAGVPSALGLFGTIG